MGCLAGVLPGCSAGAPAPDVARLLPGAAGGPGCAALLSRLPDRLDGQPVRGQARWGRGRRAAALGCGVGRPAGLTRDAQLLVVDDVAWLAERLPGATRWTAVDHRPYVALVLGDQVAADRALTAVSPVVTAALARSPLPSG